METIQSKFTTWLRDTGERVLRAYLGAFTVAVTIAQVQDFAMWKAAALAGLGPAVTVVLSALATFAGNGGSASFQPDLPKDQVQADPPLADVVTLPSGEKALPVTRAA